MIFVVFSALSTLLCAVGCVTSGVHGTKIANYRYPCKKLEHLCVCYLRSTDNHHNITLSQIKAGETDVRIFLFLEELVSKFARVL